MRSIQTSLLDCLAGRKTFGVLQGQILVNGHPCGDDWKRISAYCMQDDMFVGTLTVHETVMFSARMRLPAVMNDTARLACADAALAAMGLTGCRNTLVGDKTHKVRTDREADRGNAYPSIQVETD
jgi:ABC-type multidrug transport system ATPase subunit